MNPKILLADDHKIIRDVLARLITESITDDLSIATNGKEALNKLEQEQFDLLITDLNMPVMDGLELVRNLSNQNIEVKTLVLTMRDDAETIEALMQFKIDGYVLKEGDTEEFKNAVEMILKNGQYFSDEVKPFLK
ncbi:MAG: response regulator [Cyclobacteriaceae bacterium]